jgi:hypothetical protein
MHATLMAMLLLAAEAPATPAIGLPAAAAAARPDDSDPNPVPSGSAADQALWKEAHAVSRGVAAERLRSNEMQWRIRQQGQPARLESLAQKASPDEAARLRDLHARLVNVARENQSLLMARWPVDPTRGCQYPALDLQGVMEAAETPRKASQLTVVREETTDCVDRARVSIQAMAESNGRLERVLAEADAVLPRIPVASPPSPPPGRTP